MAFVMRLVVRSYTCLGDSVSVILEVSAILGLLLLPDVALESSRKALMLFGRDIVPSLFPYMFFCRMIGSRIRKHHRVIEPVVLILGLLGGSPSGSALLFQCAASIPERKRYALIAVTSTISPMFLLNTVNSWIADTALCRLLLCSHILGTLLAGAILWKIAPIRGMMLCDDENKHTATGDAMIQSILGILNAGGCIVIYTVISSMIKQIPGVYDREGAILHAMLEMAGGMKALCEVFPSSILLAVLLAAAAGFGGMSIMMQNHEYLGAIGVPKRDLISIGLLKAFLSSCMMVLLYSICIRT